MSSLNPHPADVLGIPKPSWSRFRKDDPLPSFEVVAGYMMRKGEAWTDQDDAAWRSMAEAMRSKSRTVNKATPTLADPVLAPARASAPVSAFTELPHMQGKPKPIHMEVMSVRVREGINARLDRYRAQVRASKQDVVSDVLDAFLAKQGF